MQDVAHFESKGLPSVGVLTTAFKSQARYQAAMLNFPECPHVFVPHPISDQTPAQLDGKADGSAVAVLGWLLDGPPPPDQDDVPSAPSAPVADAEPECDE